MAVQIDSEFNEIFNELRARVDYHINITRKESKKYFRLMWLLQLSIPILSALLTIIASGKVSEISVEKNLSSITFVVGGIITIMTVLNSSIQPSQRYAHAVKYSNKFWNLRTAMKLADYRLRSESTDEASLKRARSTFLDDRNKEITDLIGKYNEGYSAKAMEESKGEGS